MRTAHHQKTPPAGRLPGAVLPVFLFLAILATLALLAAGGCAGKVKQQRRDTSFDPQAATGDRFAVVGFVAAPDAGLTADEDFGGDTFAQSDAWSDLLYGAFLAVRPGQVTWAWPAVRDNVPDASLAPLHAALVARENVPGVALAALRADLPEIRYVVAARIDRDEIVIADLNRQGMLRDEAHPEREVDLMPDTLQRTTKIRRTVTVTLVAWDLAGGRVVWEGNVSRQRTDLLGPDSVAASRDLEVTPSDEEGGLPELEIKGTSVLAPDLVSVVAEACRALVENLYRTPE